MKIKLILLLIFLISCGSETSTENFNQVNNEEDEYLEEEYEEDDGEEYEEDSDEEEYEEDDGESLYDEYGEWDKGSTYFDTSSSTSTGWYMGQGTDREEHVHEGMQTLDGGFIAIGHHWEKEEDPTGFTDMIILKTDSKGNELWQTIIGTPNKFDVGYAVNELSDGYVASGGLYKDGFQKSAIVKLDFNGNIIWQKIFTHDGVGGIRGIEVLNNDEIVVTGYKEGDEEGFLFISDGSKGFITKMSTTGEVIWDKDLSAMQGTKVKQTSQGGFVVGSVEWVDVGLNASMHYLDSNGKIFDPHSGVADLNSKKVKFIGRPDERIKEDYLRILRFIRFSIEYSDFDFDKETLKSIKINLDGIVKLSKVRIYDELCKILKLKNFEKIYNNEILFDIFKLIFPEFKYIDRIKNLSLIRKLKDQKLNNNIILALLLIDETNNHEYFSHKYNISNETRDFLDFSARYLKQVNKDKDFFNKNLKKNIFYNSKNKIESLFLLHKLTKKKFNYKEIDSMVNQIKNISIPKFPVTGNYLLSKGIKNGKKIGD